MRIVQEQGVLSREDVAHLLRAVDERPTDMERRFALGSALYSQGRMGEADHHLRVITETAGSSHESSNQIYDAAVFLQALAELRMSMQVCLEKMSLVGDRAGWLKRRARKISASLRKIESSLE